MTYLMAASATPAVAESSTTATATATGARGGPVIAATSTRSASPAEMARDVTPGPDDREPGWRIVPRVLFFIPRWTFTITTLPFQGLAYLLDRFDLIATFQGIFFDPTLTYGIHPILGVELPFGAAVGVRAVHNDLFGRGESGEVVARFGGLFDQDYALHLDTGRRLGRTRFGLDAGLESIPRLLFFGVGNAERVEASDLESPPVDPFAGGPAVRTAVSRQSWQAQLALTQTVSRDLHVEATATYAADDYGSPRRGDEPDLRDVYEPDPFTFSEVLHLLSGTLTVRWDGRRRAHELVPPAAPSSGWRLGGELAYTAVLNAEPSFLRYGLFSELSIDLHRGTRVLALRLHLSGIGAGVDEVPLFELPSLGGPELLRGYVRGRFRDRHSALAVAEYGFPLNDVLRAFFFCDVGRVYRRLDELTESAPAVAFGGGLTILWWERLVGRLQLGGSREGDLTFTLRFDDTIALRGGRSRW